MIKCGDRCVEVSWSYDIDRDEVAKRDQEIRSGAQKAGYKGVNTAKKAQQVCRIRQLKHGLVRSLLDCTMDKKWLGEKLRPGMHSREPVIYRQKYRSISLHFRTHQTKRSKSKHRAHFNDTFDVLNQVGLALSALRFNPTRFRSFILIGCSCCSLSVHGQVMQLQLMIANSATLVKTNSINNCESWFALNTA